MRYIKVLLLAAFIFLALVFFFQNQGPLSQQMQLSLNLFFLPPLTSITLPFYFIVVSAFFVGCLLSLCWLLWDKISLSTRFMRSKWKISSLKHEVERLQAQIDEANAKTTEIKSLPQAKNASEVAEKPQS